MATLVRQMGYVSAAKYAVYGVPSIFMPFEPTRAASKYLLWFGRFSNAFALPRCGPGQTVKTMPAPLSRQCMAIRPSEKTGLPKLECTIGN